MLRAPQAVADVVKSALPAVSDEVTSATTRMQALYDAHAKAVYRFLLRLTFGERQAAEDLTQETMLRAWRNIDGLHANIDTLRPWLLTVARRVAIDAGRAKRARPTEVGVFDFSTVPSLDDAIDRMLGAETIKQALAQLSPEHCSVIVEVYYNDCSEAEAAKRLGIPTGTVKSRAYHALRNLRRALGSRSALR
jgi:RNA polymerase sigma-70 factor (ECF subfamily)